MFEIGFENNISLMNDNSYLRTHLVSISNPDIGYGLKIWTCISKRENTFIIFFSIYNFAFVWKFSALFSNKKVKLNKLMNKNDLDSLVRHNRIRPISLKNMNTNLKKIPGSGSAGMGLPFRISCVRRRPAGPRWRSCWGSGQPPALSWTADLLSGSWTLDILNSFLFFLYHYHPY